MHLCVGGGTCGRGKTDDEVQRMKHDIVRKRPGVYSCSMVLLSLGAQLASVHRELVQHAMGI